MAKHMLEASGGQRSHGLRAVMESELADVLDGHGGSDGPGVPGTVKRPVGACLTCSCSPSTRSSRPTSCRGSRRTAGRGPQVEPAVQGRRKSMGLTDRMSTRTKSWRDEGKSVFSAVRRTVPEHGTRGGAVPAAGAGGDRG